MKVEIFIARRLLQGQNPGRGLSQTIVRIAIGGIALSMVVMLLSVAIVTGFKREIADKVVGFGAHIQLTHHDSNASYETSPILATDSLLEQVRRIDHVQQASRYAIKAGVIKTATDIQGVVLKGVDTSYNAEFFDKHLVAGEVFRPADTAHRNQVMVSEHIALLLGLHVGDPLLMYFIQQPPRVRKFRIAGIYNTGLEMFDKMILIGHLSHVQKLNNWQPSQVSGLELRIAQFDRLQTATDAVWEAVGYDFQPDGSRLYVSNIRQTRPEIFTWLDLTDINVWVILSLMVIVAGVNMISALLILILERTQLIGVLKALGMRNASVRALFLYQAAYLSLRGMLWGNVLGLGMALVQKHYHVLRLDPSSYYVDTVPILLHWPHVLALNLATLLVVVLMLVGPSMVISKISPARAIRFN